MADLKYGIRSGTPNYTHLAPFKASEVLSAKSGRLVLYDISDAYWRLVANGEAVVGGYVDHSLTCSATAGQTKLPIATNVDQLVFEMPYAYNGAAATLTSAVLETIVGKLIDIYVASNIQYADNRDSVSDSVLEVVGGDVNANTLYVKVVASKQNQIA